MTKTPAPGPDPDDDVLDEHGELEANLGALTDEQWRDGHEQLAEHVGRDWPIGELEYVWNPDLDGAALIGPDDLELEEAPRG